MRARAWLGLVALLAAAGACRGRTQVDHEVLSQRASRLAENRTRADSGAGPLARWLLPAALREVSGLALDSSGRLFAHSDEGGHVYEVDYRVGVLTKTFNLGPRARGVDFEGMAVAGDRFFLLESGGRIYEFREGRSGQTVPFALHETGLGRECEFEGIAYDARAGSLVLACKSVRTRGLKDQVVLYRWPLAGSPDTALAGDSERTRGAAERLAIPLREAVGSNGWRELSPSDITVDPASGHYLIIASQQQALVEITPAGRVVSSGPLPESLAFAEGLAATGDSLLIIAAEATRGPASISVYRRS